MMGMVEVLRRGPARAPRPRAGTGHRTGGEGAFGEVAQRVGGSLNREGFVETV